MTGATAEDGIGERGDLITGKEDVAVDGGAIVLV